MILRETSLFAFLRDPYEAGSTGTDSYAQKPAVDCFMPSMIVEIVLVEANSMKSCGRHVFRRTPTTRAELSLQQGPAKAESLTLPTERKL